MKPSSRIKKPAFRHSLQTLAAISIFTLITPQVTAAEPTNSMGWIRQQIERLPDLQAAREKRNATLSQANALTQPLYNPELGAGYEQEGSAENYQLTLSQKIDWWDQRGKQSEQAELLRVKAEQEYRLNYQQTLSSTFQALVNWQASRERYQLAMEQERQLDQLINLVQDRQQSGDLGQIDVELTLLSLSQTLADTAEAVAAYQSSENEVRRWLPNWQANRSLLNKQFWQRLSQLLQSSSDKKPEQFLNTLPELRIAKAEWEIQRATAEQLQLSNKPEPSIAINAGRNGEDDVIGLNLSIPLNIRNGYQDVNQAALQQTFAAEARYLAINRELRYQLDSSRALAEQYRRQKQRWQTIMQSSQANSGELLRRQWQTGDLGTSQYLQALKQRNEGINAGITLTHESRLAMITWLYSSGQINQVFNF